MSVQVVISQQQLKELAVLVVDEMQARQSAPVQTSETGAQVAELVDATTLAGRLGISRSTVYEHAAELGAIEVGSGDRPRLRFDPKKAPEAWTRREQRRRSQSPISPVPATSARRRRPSSLGSSGFLLPVKDRSAPRTSRSDQRLDRTASGAGR